MRSSAASEALICPLSEAADAGGADADEYRDESWAMSVESEDDWRSASVYSEFIVALVSLGERECDTRSGGEVDGDGTSGTGDLTGGWKLLARVQRAFPERDLSELWARAATRTGEKSRCGGLAPTTARLLRLAPFLRALLSSRVPQTVYGATQRSSSQRRSLLSRSSHRSTHGTLVAPSRASDGPNDGWECTQGLIGTDWAANAGCSDLVSFGVLVRRDARLKQAGRGFRGLCTAYPVPWMKALLAATRRRSEG